MATAGQRESEADMKMRTMRMPDGDWMLAARGERACGDDSAPGVETDSKRMGARTTSPRSSGRARSRSSRSWSTTRRKPNRDEALFWLAHSEHQTGEYAERASRRSSRLERQFPKSRWVRSARSLRVEIAQRLHRDDVLWVFVRASRRSAASPRRAPGGHAGAAPGAAPPARRLRRSPDDGAADRRRPAYPRTPPPAGAGDARR